VCSNGGAFLADSTCSPAVGDEGRIFGSSSGSSGAVGSLFEPSSSRHGSTSSAAGPFDGGDTGSGSSGSGTKDPLTLTSTRAGPEVAGCGSSVGEAEADGGDAGSPGKTPALESTGVSDTGACSSGPTGASDDSCAKPSGLEGSESGAGAACPRDAEGAEAKTIGRNDGNVELVVGGCDRDSGLLSTAFPASVEPVAEADVTEPAG